MEMYSEMNNELCIICLEKINIKDDDTVVVCIKCNVKSHYSCLKEWYKNKRKKICPICLKSEKYYLKQLLFENKAKKNTNTLNNDTINHNTVLNNDTINHNDTINIDINNNDMSIEDIDFIIQNLNMINLNEEDDEYEEYQEDLNTNQVIINNNHYVDNNGIKCCLFFLLILGTLVTSYIIALNTV